MRNGPSIVTMDSFDAVEMVKDAIRAAFLADIEPASNVIPTDTILGGHNNDRRLPRNVAQALRRERQAMSISFQ